MPEKKEILGKKNLIEVCFLLVLFLAGAVHITSYPVNHDEKSEQAILWMNLRQYREILHPELAQTVPSLFRGEWYPVIHNAIDRDHGISMMYPFFLFLENEQLSAYVYGLIWHCYIYLLFCVGTFFFYRFLKLIFQRTEIAVLGTAIYFLSPRIFADSLHNNKDILFLTALVAVMYFGALMNEKKKWESVAAFAVAGGFLCNTRVLGFLFIAIFGVLYIVRISMTKSWSMKNFFRGLAAAAGTILSYIILTPAVFDNGKINVVEQIQYCLERSSHFNGWWAPVLFEGHLYDWYQENLPWYYIPKYILLTTPPAAILLFAAGIAAVICMSAGMKREPGMLTYSLFSLVSAIIPLMAAIISKSVLYNGWRHFYFLHGYLTVIVCMGLYYFENLLRGKWKNLLIVCVSVCVIFYYAGDLIYQVGGAMYFNVFAGRGVPVRYEMDYYGVSGKEVLQNLLNAEESDEPIVICAPDYEWSVLENAYPTLDEKYASRIVLVETLHEAEIALAAGKKVYRYFNPVYAWWFKRDEWTEVANHRLVYDYRPWGRYSGAIYFYSEFSQF